MPPETAADSDHGTVRRAFLALRPDPTSTAALTALQARLRALPQLARARWTFAADLHLTLHFLGRIDTPQRQALEAWLSRQRPPLPALPATALAVWPPASRPRVLVLELGPIAALDELATAASQAAGAVGIDASPQPFVAHLTLARLHPTTARLVSPSEPLPTLHMNRLGLYASGPPDATGRRYRALRERVVHP